MSYKTYIRNLKDFSVVAYSWNPSFGSINFKIGEMKDCSGIDEGVLPEKFELFYNTYIKTSILTLISIKVADISTSPAMYFGYFDYGYIENDWSVAI